MNTIDERRFRAMGSSAHIIVVGGSSRLAECAQRRIADLETKWSRFLPDSEVSRLSRNAGRPVAVSDDTALLVERSIEAWRMTGGAFNPTVYGAIRAAGYNEAYGHVATLADEAGGAVAAGGPIVECTDIIVGDGTVTLPGSTGFDAGGIGKGLAADFVVGELLADGAAGVCVNLGGDLRVDGEAPNGTWRVAIEHPNSSVPITTVGLVAGAVATSTTLLRAWQHDGHAAHHLIDPWTGTPSTTDLELATVVAAEAWIAEVMAKAVILRGSDRAFDLVDERSLCAMAVRADRCILTSPGFGAFAVEPVPSHIRRSPQRVFEGVGS